MKFQFRHGEGEVWATHLEVAEDGLEGLLGRVEGLAHSLGPAHRYTIFTYTTSANEDTTTPSLTAKRHGLET